MIYFACIMHAWHCVLCCLVLLYTCSCCIHDSSMIVLHNPLLNWNFCQFPLLWGLVVQELYTVHVLCGWDYITVWKWEIWRMLIIKISYTSRLNILEVYMWTPEVKMEPWARLVKLRKMSSKFRKCSFQTVHCSKLLLRMHVVVECRILFPW